MAKGNWLVAMIACAGLLGCQSMNSGPEAMGGSRPFTSDVGKCPADKNPCVIGSARIWVLAVFPRAAVEFEEIILAEGHSGKVLWTLDDKSFYFDSKSITFDSLNGGDSAFTCGLVDPVGDQSQQIQCALNSGTVGPKKFRYKYTIGMHHRGWYFVWSHDPWVIN